MFEDDNLVHVAGKGAEIVVRVSRTATGTRTWTVGASLADGDAVDTVLARVLAMDDRLAELSAEAKRATLTAVDGGKANDVPKPARAPSLGAQLADSLIIAALKKGAAVDGWLWRTTPELITMTGMARATLQHHLNRLIRAGMIEKQPGRGNHYPSRYVLAVVAPTPTAAPTRGKAAAAAKA